MNVEQWKSIPDFENYEVSDQGRIRNVKYNRVLHSQWNRGVLRINLRKNERYYSKLISNLVLETFQGVKPFGHKIIFKNDDRQDCRLCNLEYVPTDVFLIHQKRGNTERFQRKLSYEQIRHIKRDIAAGVTSNRIARNYNVDKSYISRIKNGTRAAHIQPD